MVTLENNQTLRYSDIPSTIVSSVPGFAESKEFQNYARLDLDLPGVLVGAFAFFLMRLEREHRAPSPEREEQLAAAYQTIERLARSDDPEVRNAVVVELFENLGAGQLEQRIRERLLPVSQALYDKWIVRARERMRFALRRQPS